MTLKSIRRLRNCANRQDLTPSGRPLVPIWSLFVLSLGVAADAFAASVSRGVQMRERNTPQAVLIALTFGGFQALMPLLGWILGAGFEQIIRPVDHWIAFVLLGFLGGRMIYEAFQDDDEEDDDSSLDVKNLMLLGIATSIDALAVGVTLALINANIWISIAMIGVVTAVTSYLGVLLGHHAGARWRKPAELGGGLILIAIGVQILVEHLTAAG